MAARKKAPKKKPSAKKAPAKKGRKRPRPAQAAVRKKARRKAAPVKNYARVRRQVFQLADLEVAPYNSRTITQEALKGLGESLAAFGVLAPPIVNVAGKKPRLVGGHQRVTQLEEMGATEAECIVVEFDELKEKRANFALNNKHIEGDFVPELTRALLDEIAQSAADAEGVMKSLRLDMLTKQIIRNASASAADLEVRTGQTEDDDIPPYSSSKALSKTGTIYKLGDHLLYCGRLAEPGDLNAFGVESADMALTIVAGKKQWTEDGLNVLLAHAIANTEGGIYFATNDAHLAQVQELFAGQGGYWSTTIVAYDPDLQAKKTQPLRNVSIPLIYGWRAGVIRHFYGNRSQGNAWKLKGRVTQNVLPVEAAVNAILNSTTVGQLVLDVNVTDGSTVIAAEKTGRKVVGIVPTPKDMDRVRRRWTEFAKGKKSKWQTATKATT